MWSTWLLIWAGVCTFMLTIEVNSTPTTGSIIEAIEKAAASISEESLKGDTTLINKVQKVNSVSTFSLRHGDKPLFTRKTSETEKAVVVLSPGEDHLIVTNFKRTFVVLKQSPLNATAYRVFYAYIRDAKPDDQSALNVGDSKIRIEFDKWDGRGSSKNLVRSLGWTTCFESVYPSCRAHILPHNEQDEIISPAENSIVDYSGEDEELTEGTTQVPKPRQPDLRSGADESEPSYYDLFADLDDTAESRKYIYGTVGIFTYAMSAATISAPMEALVASGIDPTFPDKAEAHDIKDMKLEDMKRSVALFQSITNSSGPVEQHIPEKMLPQAQGRSMSDDDYGDEPEGPVDMERFKRLKAQYVELLDDLEKLSKLYPKTPGGDEIPAENTTVSEDLSPKKQLNEYKSKAIKFIERMGTKVKTVLGAILEQSEVGQELKDNPEEGQDLLSEEDPEKLIETDDDVKEDVEKDEVKKLSEKEIKRKKAEEKLRAKKKKERAAKKLLEEKRKASAEKKKNGEKESPKGGLLGGGLLGILLGKKRRKRETPPEEEGYFSYYTNSIRDTLGLRGDSAIEVATNVAQTAALNMFGFEGLLELGSKAMESMTDDGEIDKFSLITKVGGSVVDQTLRKVPIVGDPLAYLGDLAGGAFTSAAGFVGLGLGRSIYGSGKEKPAMDTDLFGHIGWRSSDINPEELYTQSLAIEGEAPFVGFGNCPRKNLKLDNFQEVDMSETKIVDLYLSLLRVQCAAHQNKYISKLFNEKVLVIDQDGTIAFNQQSPILNQGKWTKIESAELSSAFELSVFSKTILAEWKTPTAPVALDGSKITKSVHTFILAGINAIETASKILPNHFVKLVRNVELTLKTGFTELLQDYDRYKACSRCEGEIFQTATNDLRALYSLIQFIVNDGLRQVDLGTKDTRSAFKDFHELNRDSINEKLKSFL